MQAKVFKKGKISLPTRSASGLITKGSAGLNIRAVSKIRGSTVNIVDVIR